MSRPSPPPANPGPRRAESILQTIGDTTLLDLRHVVQPGHARVMLKLEAENPTGSMKESMALAMIEAAEADGRLIGEVDPQLDRSRPPDQQDAGMLLDRPTQQCRRTGLL